jgi:hypothetical protein
MGDGAAASGYTAAGLLTPFGAALHPRWRVDNGRNINRLGANPRQALAGASGPTEFGGTVLVDSTAAALSGEARAGPDPGQGFNAEMA